LERSDDTIEKVEKYFHEKSPTSIWLLTLGVNRCDSEQVLLQKSKKSCHLLHIQY